MLRSIRRLRNLPGFRHFASEDVIVEDGLETETKVPQKSDVKPSIVRLLPVPRHPIFPDHYVRFRFSNETFKFLVKDQHSSNIAAFVLKPTEGKNELESKLGIQ
jgi:hypothetical protein